jgi:hypothetical protein
MEEQQLQLLCDILYTARGTQEDKEMIASQLNFNSLEELMEAAPNCDALMQLISTAIDMQQSEQEAPEEQPEMA